MELVSTYTRRNVTDIMHGFFIIYKKELITQSHVMPKNWLKKIAL